MTKNWWLLNLNFCTSLLFLGNAVKKKGKMIEIEIENIAWFI